MLERLDHQLGRRREDLDRRIRELMGLREEIGSYQEHVRRRIRSAGRRRTNGRGRR
jgi:hypothetical protein